MLIDSCQQLANYIQSLAKLCHPLFINKTSSKFSLYPSSLYISFSSLNSPPPFSCSRMRRLIFDLRAFAVFANSGIDWVVIFKSLGDSFILDEEDLNE